MDRLLYELEIELRPRPGARFPKNVEGAFVRFYIAADDFMEALARMRNAVDVDRYALIEILLCRRLELQEWQDEKEDLFGEEAGDYPDCEDLAALLTEDGWTYGPFYGYTDEDQKDNLFDLGDMDI